MEIAAKLLSVLGLAAIEIWVAIPAGFVLGLHPISIAVASALGGMIGAAAVILLGERVRTWVMRTFSRNRDPEKPSRARQVWNRYGVVGLGLLAPLLTGAPLGIALGLSLGAPSRALFFWTTIGIIFWSITLTLVTALGLHSIASS